MYRQVTKKTIGILRSSVKKRTMSLNKQARRHVQVEAQMKTLRVSIANEVSSLRFVAIGSTPEAPMERGWDDEDDDGG